MVVTYTPYVYTPHERGVYRGFLPPTIIARGARSAVAVAAAYRTICARLEGELGDRLAAIRTRPVALNHIARLTRRALRTSRAARAVTVATLERIELVTAGLERQLSNLSAALRARPVTLHLGARGVTTVVITVHIW